MNSILNKSQNIISENAYELNLLVNQFLSQLDYFDHEIFSILESTKSFSKGLLLLFSELKNYPKHPLKLSTEDHNFPAEIFSGFTEQSISLMKNEVPLLTCVAFFKYYRKAYLQLLHQNLATDKHQSELISWVNYYFDLGEMYACREYQQSVQETDKILVNFKKSFKRVVKRKNQLLSILECIDFPSFHIDDTGYIHRANFKGYKLLPTHIQYSVDRTSWLTSLDEEKLRIDQLIENYFELHERFVKHGEIQHRVMIDGVFYKCHFSRYTGTTNNRQENDCNTIIFLQDISEEIGSELALQTEREQRLFEQQEIISILGEILESRSGETGLHVQRVSYVACYLAELHGLPPDEVNIIKTISPLHDVGKVGISDVVLNKPDPLSDEEFNLIKTHTSIGYNILNKSHSTLTKMAAVVAYEHHEKWNGSGYPCGKSGTQIHLYARIVAIADVFDALLSKRPYKDAWTHFAVLNHFKQQSGKHFDPELADLFIKHFDEFVDLHSKLKDFNHDEYFQETVTLSV